MRERNLLGFLAAALAGAALIIGCQAPPEAARKIGVIYVFHGGFSERDPSSLWDATLQIFSYDPHSAVFQNVIWNDRIWPSLLDFGNAPKERGKYDFEYRRVGGRDPANDLTRERYRQLKENLESRESELGVDFIVDYASWLSADPTHHAFPRMLYVPGVEGGKPLTYCGEQPGSDGSDAWPGCDPERFNVDGTVERLLKQGVDSIVMIDLTTSGVRFFKTFDVVNLSRQVVAAWNQQTGDSVTVRWINDPTDLMTESYPDTPSGWTLSLGAPENDPKISIENRPNPVSSDPRLAEVHADGIVARFNPSVDVEETGVLLVNHATRVHNSLFDPKINDTLILNANIRDDLLNRYPGMKPEQIVGGWFGRKEVNPRVEAKPPKFDQRERTRRMRGENLGDAFLYDTVDESPTGWSGYRYWEGLESLKKQGLKHIVVAFPQIMVDSVLNMVEVPNQIGKEIGYRSWLRINELDMETYPEVGHPFADYWGVWVEKQCPLPGEQGEGPCCFKMGGCPDGRPYPPPRITPVNEARDDLDPSLAYDVSAYGHLGYDATQGEPDENGPVQAQFRGTWDMWNPPNDDPRIAEMMADQIVAFQKDPDSQRPSPPPIDLGLVRVPVSRTTTLAEN